MSFAPTRSSFHDQMKHKQLILQTFAFVIVTLFFYTFTLSYFSGYRSARDNTTEHDNHVVKKKVEIRGLSPTMFPKE